MTAQAHPSAPQPSESPSASFAVALGRAYAGAVLFALPLIMTQEMWSLGSTVDPWRLALFQVLFFPFLVLLSWHAGFESTFSWRDDVVDALVAYAVGITAAGVLLLFLGVLDASLSFDDVVGKVTLQAIPASIGALLAQTQLGEKQAHESPEHGGEGYASDLFVMAVGALFLGFNVAPTGEVTMLALRMAHWQSILLIAVSVVVMHSFVYVVAFQGQDARIQRATGWSLFLRYSVVGYVIACVLSAYVLWTFGRLDGLGTLASLKVVLVLALPSTFGAAAARLIL